MTDIVVSVPQSMEGRKNFYAKVADIGNAFWTMGRTPKNLHVHDWIWFVTGGLVAYGVEIKEIERGPLEPFEDARGHNPAVGKNGCRLTFFESESASIWTSRSKDEKHFPAISCKGFQGFRYKWWKWPWEANDKASIINKEVRKCWNKHLSRDHRGNYSCSHYKECSDCEYNGKCLAQESSNNKEVGTQ